MSSNCIDYDRKSGRMKIEDLAVGQTLIRVYSSTWRASSVVKLTRWTIKRVLKTRLVITSESGTEVRLLVHDGVVSDRREGQGTWSREYYALYTTDDPGLQDIVDRARAAKAKRDVEDALRAALEDLQNTSTSLETVEAVDAAILSLTAYRDAAISSLTAYRATLVNTAE